MDKITEKIEYMMEKCPEKVMELAKLIYKQDPDIVERMLDYPDDAEHITSRRKYEELVERIKWVDGNGRGAKWSFEDIKKNSRIDFANVDYTEFDYAYLVNMLYAKCSKYITDPSIYLKLAKCLLEDRDEETKIYRGHNINKQSYIKHNMQDSYKDYSNNLNKYDEEDRHRRYRNPYMNDDYNMHHPDERRYNDEYKEYKGFFK